MRKAGRARMVMAEKKQKGKLLEVLLEREKKVYREKKKRRAGERKKIIEKRSR